MIWDQLLVAERWEVRKPETQGAQHPSSPTKDGKRPKMQTTKHSYDITYMHPFFHENKHDLYKKYIFDQKIASLAKGTLQFGMMQKNPLYYKGWSKVQKK